MTDPRPQAWTDRIAGGRVLLVVGLTLAIVTASAWLYLARGDGTVAYREIPVGQTATVAATEWTLDGLYLSGTVAGSDQALVPVHDATFVVARLSVDLSGLAKDKGCLFMLRAGEYRFGPAYGFVPSGQGIATTCQPGFHGQLWVAFEVPTRLVEKVDGFGVQVDAGPVTLLRGSLG